MSFGNSGVCVDKSQSLNRYAYVMNNPLNAKDPLGLECMWDDGSYDAEDDPTTGSVGGCDAAGGTWVELGQGGGWSSQPDAWGQNLVANIQAGNVSQVNNVGIDGQTYSCGSPKLDRPSAVDFSTS